MSLAQYLEESGSDLDDVYSNGRSWSYLRADAGLPQQAPGPEEQTLRRACGRLLHLDDMEGIETYRHLLADAAPPLVSPPPSLRGAHRNAGDEAISRPHRLAVRHAGEILELRFDQMEGARR